ncbi:NAD(P)-dependent oxidoreductase [Polynucleobacter sp. Tro8-14-1]|uniref:NAD-dependent epimerase/dehydratase family protein n=1 Tax=Polynucleobacter sp. Tro8-14-1 TaxID=1758383 RepID=UPI001C0D517C|nr:NAD(P)-dependent oxidoreductase [Polynucleobacter sp. Tro8-14-1]MBU3563635.1 NAD(P)-dependent oxidoreductase [Polynucleobacter sp. Tro8-14-1]
MNSTQYVLTGASGWLGRRVALALTRGMPELGAFGKGGKRIRCLVPAGENAIDLHMLDAEIIRGDVNDVFALEDLMRGASDGVLIHMAGIIHPPGRTERFNSVNVKGTRQVLEMAKLHGIKRMVVMSSNSPFGGNLSPEDIFNEGSPYNPYMGYGKSKMQMEKLLLEHMASGLGPEVVVLRAPWFYGPGQPPRQTLFFTMIKEGRFPIIGNGLNRRSMGYVDSLAFGVLLAAENLKAANQVFWLADKTPYTIVEIISTVKEVLREDFGIQVSPRQLQFPSMVSDIARVADSTLQSLGLYNQKFHVLSEMNMTIACNIHKAQTILDYEPLVELREGMRRSVEWCLTNGQTI